MSIKVFYIFSCITLNVFHNACFVETPSAYSATDNLRNFIVSSTRHKFNTYFIHQYNVKLIVMPEGASSEESKVVVYTEKLFCL